MMQLWANQKVCCTCAVNVLRWPNADWK